MSKIKNSDGFITIYDDGTVVTKKSRSIQEAKINITTSIDLTFFDRITPVKFNYRKQDDKGNYTKEAEEGIEYGIMLDKRMKKHGKEFIIDDNIDYDKLGKKVFFAIKDLRKRMKKLEKLIRKIK